MVIFTRKRTLVCKKTILSKIKSQRSNRRDITQSLRSHFCYISRKGVWPQCGQIKPETRTNTAFLNSHISKKHFLSPYSWGFSNVNKLLISKKSCIYQFFSKKGLTSPPKSVAASRPLSIRDHPAAAGNTYWIWRCLMTKIEICSKIVQSIKDYLSTPSRLEAFKAKNRFVRKRLLTIIHVIMYLLFSNRISEIENLHSDLYKLDRY